MPPNLPLLTVGRQHGSVVDRRSATSMETQMSVIERVGELEARTRRMEARLAALEDRGADGPARAGGGRAREPGRVAAHGAGRAPAAARILRAASRPVASALPFAAPARPAPGAQPRGPDRRAGARLGGWAVAARGAAVPARRRRLARLDRRGVADRACRRDVARSARGWDPRLR